MASTPGYFLHPPLSIPFPMSNYLGIDVSKDKKEAGFTLSEIKHLLNSWNSKELTPDRKKTIVNGKIEEIDAKRSQLKQVKNILLTMKLFKLSKK